MVRGMDIGFYAPLSNGKIFDNIRIERLNDNRFLGDKKGDNTSVDKVELGPTS